MGPDARRAQEKRRELRNFGFSLGVVCLLWSGLLAWRGRMAPVPWLLAAGPLLVLLGWLAPRALQPLHRVWMPVAGALARGVTWLLLSGVFYLVFTPYGMILRALGKDPLERRLDPRRDSYWTLRHEGPFDPERLKKQY